MPTTAAAVRCLALSAERWSWDAYFAVCRHGGFDMSLGPDGGTEHKGKRVFWLVRIVGRIWAALHLYREFTTQFEVKGPWECSVALLKTSGAALGNFGTGWAEYGDPFANARPCPEPNLLWRRELEAWPAGEEAQRLAFAIGAWIEDSFGSQNRRFLAHQGPFAGQFDLSKYR